MNSQHELSDGYRRFVSAAISQQEANDPTTRSGMIMSGVKLLGLMLIPWAVFGYLVYSATVDKASLAESYAGSVRSMAPLLGPIGFLTPILLPIALILFPFIILGGTGFALWQILLGLVSRAHAVTCPFCQTSQNLLGNPTSAVCPTCGKLQMLALEKTDDVRSVECPSCKSAWGAAPDLGALDCPDCGVPLQMNAGTLSSLPLDGTCPACGAAIASGAFACFKCGELKEKPNLDSAPTRYETNDWSGTDLTDDDLTGKQNKQLGLAAKKMHSAEGHLLRAAWLVELTRRTLAEMEASGKPQTSLFSLTTHLARLDRAIAHIFMAVDLDKASLPAAGCMLSAMDTLAGATVKWALNPNSDLFHFSLDSGSYFANEKKINKLLDSVSEGHNTLVERLQAQGNASSMPWPEPLFTFTGAGDGKVVTATFSEWERWSKDKKGLALLNAASPASLEKIKLPVVA